MTIDKLKVAKDVKHFIVWVFASSALEIINLFYLEMVMDMY